MLNLDGLLLANRQWGFNCNASANTFVTFPIAFASTNYWLLAYPSNGGGLDWFQGYPTQNTKEVHQCKLTADGTRNWDIFIIGI